MSNPIAPQPDQSLAPVNPTTNEGWNVHGHAPNFGGEITWNDVQLIRQLNSEIRRINRERAQQFFTEANYEAYVLNEDGIYFPGKLPYIFPMDQQGYPSQGYNRHGHVNDFDGGAITEAGPHDHRGVGYGGFAFCVLHPGTSIPLRSYKIE